MPAPENTILTVGQLNGQIRDTLQGAFRSVWVAGEITDLSRPSSGHLYFSLKDSSGAIKIVIWRTSAARLSFDPEDGMQVLCCGDVDVYPPRGTYQLIARQMKLQGEGELQAALRKLRDQLEDEGLFEPSHKRRLPAFPKRIAVVTSPSGAALRDFLEVVRRRWSDLEVIIVPTRVQGLEVGPEIALAIHHATRIAPVVDAVLLTRGGGSFEDLWGFNDERVVRAVFNSPIPIVSAVGHEIDITLSDLVADVRALTPSEAGELLVPDAREWNERLVVAGQRMGSVLQSRYGQAHARLSALAESRVFRDPFTSLRDCERMRDELQQRAYHAIKRQADKSTTQISNYASRLETLSPLRVLGRGYSLTQKSDGRIVRSTEDLEINEEIQVRLSNGQLSAIVSKLDAAK